MKIKDITEMVPYHIEYDPPDGSWVKPGSFLHPISMKAIRRDYDLIVELPSELNELKLKMFRNKRAGSVIIGYDVIRETDEEPSIRVALMLLFKSSHGLVNVPNDIDESRLLQVDKVHTIPELRNMGLAMFAYATLARLGYVILSDEDQYDGGVGLWKSMARQARLHDYQVNVVNVLSGYVTGKDGKPIQFDGTNIAGSKIWTTGSDFSGRYILLMLRAK